MRTRRARLLGLIPVLTLSAGCGGDSSGPTPPGTTAQTVTVTVATSGEDLDADGYTVTLGSRSAAVNASGSVSFDEVAPGTYDVRLTGVAANCAVDGGNERDVTVGTSSGAQVSFQVTCAADPADGLTTVACPDLSVSAAGALPLAEVAIGRLPGTLGDAPWARLSWEGGDETSAGYVAVGDDGSAELLVPLHPMGRREGGHVTIRFTDGERACAPVDFEVEPLAPAPGELSRVVDLIESEVARQADLFGYTLADLEVDDPLTLPPYLIPAAVAHDIVDGPDHASSLRAVLDGGLEPGVLELAEALLARVGVADALEPGSSPTGAPGAGAAQASAPAPPVRSALRSGPLQQAGQFPCTEFALEDAARLEECMEAADDAAQRSVQGAGPIFDQLALAAGVAGLSDGPEKARVAAMVVVVSWLSTHALGGAARLLPARLLTITVEYREGLAEDEPDPVTWHTLRGTAGNSGWHVDPSFLEPTLDLIDTRSPDFLAFMNRLEFPGSDIASAAADYLLSPLIANLMGGQPSPFSIPFVTFGPVNLTAEEWSRSSRRVSGTSVELVGRRGYKGVEVGESTVEIEIEIASKLYHHVFDVEVLPVEVVFTVPEVWLQPGVSFHNLVGIRNSVEPQEVALHLKPSPLQGTADLSLGSKRDYLDVTLHSVPYVAPEEPNFERNDTVIVTHENRVGARANGPERADTAVIHFADVTITPESACVTPGETEPFEAKVEGLEDESVVWMILPEDAGVIDSDGLYTAPEIPPPGGTVLIGAASAERLEITDQVEIQVGGCTCSWTVTLDEQLFEGQPGDSLLFQELYPGEDNYQFLAGIRLIAADGQIVHIGAEHGGSEPTGGPVSYDGQVGGNIGTSVAPPSLAYDTRYPGPYVGEEPDWAEATVELEEYVVASKLRGSVSGAVALHLNMGHIDDAPRVPFEATFHIQIPKDYSEILKHRRTFVCEIQAPSSAAGTTATPSTRRQGR